MNLSKRKGVRPAPSGWNFARTLKDMPHASGRYLLMDELGVFFVGYWSAGERRLYTQCIGCGDDGKGVCRTNDTVRMARWNWKYSGRVFWKNVGRLDYLDVYKRAKGKLGPRYGA